MIPFLHGSKSVLIREKSFSSRGVLGSEESAKLELAESSECKDADSPASVADSDVL